MSSTPSIKLILASGSPRRRQLLEAHGYDFEVIVPDDRVEASVPTDLPPKEFVAAASIAKAKAVVETLQSAIVLAADTVAVCDSAIIGKPADRDHAKQILQTLGGRQHAVLTGMTLWNAESDRKITHVESTELVMKSLADRELNEYLDSGQWAGKAGAFGYQDGLDWVRIEEGLESNVVGLPVELLGELISSVR